MLYKTNKYTYLNKRKFKKKPKYKRSKYMTLKLHAKKSVMIP